MKQRIIATAILWLLVIGLIGFLGKWGAFILIAPFAAGAFIELAGLMQLAGKPVDRTVGLAAFMASLIGVMVLPPWMIPPEAIFLLVLAVATGVSLFKTGIGSFGATILPTLGGVILLLMPFASIVLILHETEYGLAVAIWVLAVVKFGDVGALLCGMWLGKHKMAPAFSPKKTWEGLAGGLLLSVLVSVGYVVLADKWLPDGLTPLHAAWAALFISLAGVVGDLAESAFKREAGVKDSGSAIPGIGGCLDLVDSMILAFPVGYCLTWIIF